MGESDAEAPLQDNDDGDNTSKSSQERVNKWPEPLDEAAFHGLTGQVVEVIKPHTEADPAALLTTFLNYFGNALGRSIHAVAEADRHGTNINLVLVGETAKGRKGSSNGHIRELFRRVDPTWTEIRVMGGLSSGEGLIWSVRDPIEKIEAVKEKGKLTGESQSIVVDAGVEDKIPFLASVPFWYVQVHLLVLDAAPQPFHEECCTGPCRPCSLERQRQQHAGEGLAGELAALVGVKICGRPLLKASSRAATQKSTSRVLDSRQAST